MSAVFSHRELGRAMPTTYCVAAALEEGAHCGVELLDGDGHGGLRRCGNSSLFGWLVCRWPPEALQQSTTVWA